MIFRHLFPSYLVLWLATIQLSATHVVAADGSSQAVSPQATLAAKAIQLPAGFTLKTVASEPNLANPVAFCFDPSGRIFVAETYRVKKGIEDDREHMDWLDDDLAARTVADRREYLKRHMGKRIRNFTEASEQVRLLEDRDSDGVYEFSSIFSTGYKNIEDGTAAGVMWSNDRLLFTCIPSLWSLRDTDGDGKADKRDALATGFGVHTAFYGHDLHGLCEGPDGKVYFSIGDRGLNVDTPDGALINTGSGAVLRCNPDGSQLELFATGLRNPQELAFNEFGDLFTVDNNSDSGDKARLVHVVEGMDAGWRMAFQYIADRGPFNREKIWLPKNAEQPASIIPPVANIADGPSGLVHYPGTGLPKAYNGAFFLVDFLGAAATSGIRQFRVEREGATYRLDDYRSFITGVLATDCDFGPDGNFYVLDWVEGWEGAGLGRIHRVTSEDTNAAKQRVDLQAAKQKLASASVAELIAMLDHPDMRVRLGAQRRLVDGGADSADALKRFVVRQDAPPRSRMHAIWALGQLAEREPELFEVIARLCGDGNAELRTLGARTMSRAARCDLQRRTKCGQDLTPLLADSSPRVRALACISIAKLRYSAPLEELLQLADKDGDDPTLRHSIAMALASGHKSDKLVEAAKGATVLQRLVLVVALGKQRSPLVAAYLADVSERVLLEAARLIWDGAIPGADRGLAALIDQTKSTSEPLLRRVLAANVAQRTPKSLEAVVKFASRSDLDANLRNLAWEQVRHWMSPSPRDSVIGDWRPLAGRPADEVVAVLRKSLPKLVEVSRKNPNGLIVAAELGVNEAFPPLMAILSDGAQAEAVRVRALEAFAKANETEAHSAIDVALKSPSARVRSAARKLWTDRFPAQVVAALADTINTGTVHERQEAMDLLASLRNPAANEIVREWMGKLETGRCPPELQIEVLDAAAKSSDATLVGRQKQIVDKLGSEGPITQYAQCLSGGDVARGKLIFETNDTLACRRCHSTKQGELLVGPNLANIGNQRKPAEILESIVSPNAKISEGFESTVLELDSGKTVVGIVRHEDRSRIELVDAEGKTIFIDPAAVENRLKGKSAMPDKLTEHMSRRELRDVVAYLSQLQAPDVASKPAQPTGN
jgi:quinoprotein glucose dehydrogenase